MTMRRLAFLQWVGLLLGAAIWAAQHLTGSGIAYVGCSPGGTVAGVSHKLWEGVLMGCAAALVIAAEAASIAVLRGTEDTSYQGEPPESRIRFFAIAAAVSNVIFLVIILLDGIANLFDVVCRQS